MRSEVAERRGRGVRRVAVPVAFPLAAVGVSLALAACGNDDSSDTDAEDQLSGALSEIEGAGP